MNNYSRLSGASALSARTARACESCLKRRARWFCPPDDAFLCHPCDSSVHSANELAGRHTRVRLSSSSTSTSSSNLTHNNTITHPAWHRGFTRKARTPRRWNKKNQNDCGTPTATTLVVPQMESEVIHPESGGCFDDGRYYSIINGLEEKDHHELGFSVPVLDEDPFEREVRGGSVDQHEFDFSMVDFVGSEDHQDPSWDILPGFDLACLEGDDVAATVELEKLVVKAEDESGKEEEVVDYWDMEIFGSSIVKQEEKKKKGDAVVMEKDDEYGSGRGGEGWLSNDNNNKKRRKLMMLQLNYDEVIQAWNRQGCPAWSAGHVDLPTIDAWSTSSSYATTWQGGGGLAKEMGHGAHQQQQGNCCRHQGSNEDDADGGRGARVMRYREKRKNRLFAKKIRYQVRKLNAEKRPRLKGRFVKRTPGSAIPNPTMAFTRRHSSFPSPPTGATGLGPGIGVGVGQTHH